jgi:peptidyl-prolyl cis-trans isomerase D
MSSFFRRVSKSKIGTGIVAVFFILILVGFALGDLQNFGSGNLSFGMGSSTLARVGDQQITEREMSDAMQRRLQDVRQQKPEADYATIVGDFERILGALVDERALIAFANKFDFHISKRLVDAEIAQIPQTRGLNGKFDEQRYLAFLSQQRLTDAQVREILAGTLVQRLMFSPAIANPRVPVGLATPYASMLLEAREGQMAAVPISAFKAGLNPTDADLQAFYSANRTRYMIPEQRVIRLARIGPEQVANVAPSDEEITAYYNANRTLYAPRELRSVTQAVAQDRATANAIAAKVKADTTMAAAAGSNAAVTTARDQGRSAYAEAAGERVAAAVFAAPSGAVVGPIQGDFGWVVAKVDSVKTEGGKSTAEARSEIAAKLTADKRKQAIEDLVDRVQTAVDDGSNFTEAAADAKLAATATPLIVVSGTSRTDPSYRAPAELAPALKTGFEIAPNDHPVIVSLPNDQGYALVSPAEVRSAAPAPLAAIRDRVTADWVTSESQKRARAAAGVIAAKVARGMPLDQALKDQKVGLPAVRQINARRIQIATATEPVPPALQAMFSILEGKSRMVPDPKAGAFFIVKVTKVVPGNALLQPGLISRMQNELQQATADDYASQLMSAIRTDMNVRRNESAIAAEKERLRSTAG